ncbi:hypothetical protein FOL47_008626 [Perkinsus chesapeaki]|uniref:Uncharacterized protein n=1 Tax=Perkinsus chesapeaki TaxID=330153 RepID=A0A7J6LCV1_PERCH|nr:hypothetical protein FOL47_008626 [Perkinsus chesapeaki]
MSDRNADENPGSQNSTERPDTAMTVQVGQSSPSNTTSVPSTLPVWKPHAHSNPLHAQYCCMCLYGKRPEAGERAGSSSEQGESDNEQQGPTFEELCDRGFEHFEEPWTNAFFHNRYLVHSVATEAHQRMSNESDTDQSSETERAPKIFRQKADFEKENIPAKLIEECLDTVYTSAIGHDVAAALKDDIKLDSVSNPEMASQAWDMVEEMNALTEEEKKEVEEHCEEFDAMPMAFEVLSARPPDLMLIDKQERGEKKDSSDIELPPITLSVDYEPPLDGLDEELQVAGQRGGVPSMDIPIRFDEEPRAGCTVHPEPPEALKVDEDLPKVPPQKMIDIVPVSMPPPEFFPDIIGPPKAYTLEHMEERELPQFDKLEVTLTPTPSRIWEKDRGIDVNKLVHEELLPNIDAAILYGKSEPVKMDNGIRARLSEQIEKRLQPRSEKSFAKFEWPAPPLEGYPPFLVSLLRESFRCESASQVISQRHEIVCEYKKNLKLQEEQANMDETPDEAGLPVHAEVTQTSDEELKTTGAESEGRSDISEEEQPDDGSHQPSTSERASSRHSVRRSTVDADTRSNIAMAVKEAFNELFMNNDDIITEIANRIKDRVPTQTTLGGLPAPPPGLLPRGAQLGRNLIPVSASKNPRADEMVGSYVASQRAPTQQSSKIVAPDAPVIEGISGESATLPRDDNNIDDGELGAGHLTLERLPEDSMFPLTALCTLSEKRACKLARLDKLVFATGGLRVGKMLTVLLRFRVKSVVGSPEDATFFNDIDNYTVERRVGDAYIRLPTAAYSRPDLSRHIRPNKGQVVDPEPSLILDSRLNAQRLQEAAEETPAPTGGETESGLSLDNTGEEERGIEVLISCVRHNRFEAVESLIEEDRSLIERRYSRMSCAVGFHDLHSLIQLSVLSRFNHTSLAEFLIANGADETKKNNDGVLPHMMRLSGGRA